MTGTRALFLCDGAPERAHLAGDPTLERRLLNWRPPAPNVNLRADNLDETVLESVQGRAADLVRLASCIYAADQDLSRGGQADVHREDWYRTMIVCVPVADPAFWSQPTVRAQLSEVLHFATDDTWEFEFSPLRPERSPMPMLLAPAEMWGRPDSVLLFSGGADSLCAAVEWTQHRRHRPVLVSHRSSALTDGRQTRLLRELNRYVAGWTLSRVSFWVHRRGSDAADTNQRSRGFLFASLGAAVADQLRAASVVLADNGIVSLNLPISAQLVGALASRSTHPKFIALFNRLIRTVLDHPPTIVNPLWARTRAETLAILGQIGGEALLQHTHSCSHPRARPASRPYCGICSQCVDRRFGVLAAGLEAYDPAGRYDLDIFTEALPEGEPRTVAESYVRFARTVHATPAGDLFEKFPELYDCVLPDDPQPDRIAEALTGLLQRHAEDTLGALGRMIGRYQDALALDALPEDCLLRLTTAPRSQPQAPVSERPNTLRRRGKLWEVTYGGMTAPVPDSKGLRYLIRLLKEPGREIHALDLVAAEAPGSHDGAPTALAKEDAPRPAPRRDVDPIVNDRTALEYGRRLREIAESRAEAAELGNAARDAELDLEVAAIRRELKAGRGLGGKPRPFPDEGERARQAVHKAIRRSLESIEAAHPELGRHLRGSIKLGYACSYTPSTPVRWVA